MRAPQPGSRAHQSTCTGGRAALLLRCHWCCRSLSPHRPCLALQLRHALRVGPAAEARGKRGLGHARGRLRPMESLRTRTPRRSTPATLHWPPWPRRLRRGPPLRKRASSRHRQERASWGMRLCCRGRRGRRWQRTQRAVGARLAMKAARLPRKWPTQRRALRWSQRSGIGPTKSKKQRKFQK